MTSVKLVVEVKYLGTEEWTLGNPLISNLVSSYMLGLYKCKVCFETHW